MHGYVVISRQEYITKGGVYNCYHRWFWHMTIERGHVVIVIEGLVTKEVLQAIHEEMSTSVYMEWVIESWFGMHVSRFLDLKNVSYILQV